MSLLKLKLVMMLVLWTAVAMPIEFAFRVQVHGLLFAVNILLSLVFLLDTAFSFRTAFEEDGQWVKQPGQIASAYLKSWFWIDAPSSVPVELIDMFMEGDSSQLGMLRFLRLFRLLRLLRLLKVRACYHCSHLTHRPVPSSP